MAEGRSLVLVHKGKSKGHIAGNHTSITCLSFRSFIKLTRTVENYYQKSRKTVERSQEEQVICCLYKVVKKELKTCKKNLEMAWIDSKEVFDILHIYALKIVVFCGISKNVRDFTCNSLKKWTADLCLRENALVEVNIRRDFFHRNSLNQIFCFYIRLNSTECCVQEG